jgi:hypothetical protein
MFIFVENKSNNNNNNNNNYELVLKSNDTKLC